MQVTVLAGGVGGARFVDGLVRVIPARDVTVIGNVGDDLELLGLSICPDLDTILYTLSGVVEQERGWGWAGDTANALAVVSRAGGDDWFFLSDSDLGLHLVRTERLRSGEPLSRVTASLCRSFGVEIDLIPATDDRLRTVVTTAAGELDFQTYFVRRRHQDEVESIRFDGAVASVPAPGAVEALDEADVVLIAPSNPLLSIDPILAVPGLREALAARSGPVCAVSPIVAGKAVKGPADRLLRSHAGEASATAVARHYGGLITHMLVDDADRDLLRAIEALGLDARAAPTLMPDADARAGVARAALDLALSAAQGA